MAQSASLGHFSINICMDPIFEAYLGCFVEKEVSDEYSIYVTCKLSQSLHDQWKALVGNLDEAAEVETEPHCTFLWAKLAEDVDSTSLYELVKNHVEGLSFDLMPMGFKVFNGVSGGTQDCLVVSLDVPGDVQQIQSELIESITSAGVELIQDYPKWSPHMTIAYFPEGTEIKYDNPTNGMLDASISAQVDFMKVNNGKEMDLN